MADKFLNYTQLQTFLNKLKELFATKSVATTSANGLMAASDKTKLNGLENYTLPTASTSTLGGVKVDGETIKIQNGVIHAEVSGGRGNVNDVQMDGTTILDSNHNANIQTLSATDIDNIMSITLINTEDNRY